MKNGLTQAVVVFPLRIYQRLGEHEDDSWFCTGCMMAELPFFNASRNGRDEEECALFGNQPLVELAREAEHVGHSRQNEGGLVVSHLNIRSILLKHDELQVFLESFTKASVFGLSESWLDEDVLDAELVVAGFTRYRKNWNRKGGGILVYISEDVRSVRRQDLEDEGIEAMWIEVRMRKRQGPHMQFV